MSKRRILVCVLFCLCCLWFTPATPAQTPRVTSGPGYLRQDFRVTTFVTSLHFPLSMQRLSDGSYLVGTSNPTGGNFFVSVGELIRLVDFDNDGVADDSGTVVFTGLPGGVTSIRLAGNLILVTSSQAGSERITVLRMGKTPADPLISQGSLNFRFPSGWEHTTFALAVTPVPGQSKTYHVVFNVGSKENSSVSTETVGLQGLLTGAMNGESLYRFTLQDTGSGVNASNLAQIAHGLRNAAGIAFHPTSGDLYFQDNGIDLPSNRNEPLSADELNVIPAAQIGQTIPEFGFPNSYIQYRTGVKIGGGTQPLFAFQPIPHPFTGSESEGAVEIAHAPNLFPAPLRQSVFIGFHGKYSQAGLVNEENPVLCCDLPSGSYYQFIGNDEPGIGHPDGLLATTDSLFIVDWSSTGGVGQSDTGAIYQIKYAPFTRLSVPGLTAMAGQTVNLSATLTLLADGSRVAGQRLTFKVDNRVVGTATTNSQGVATLRYVIPVRTRPGIYSVQVDYPGQSIYRSSRRTASMRVK